jgi:uroporphyrin-III C-methyltransferase/precorrin-2 dehydrogenase/sirohydrochlorin ferrochelatase
MVIIGDAVAGAAIDKAEPLSANAKNSVGQHHLEPNAA